MGWAGVSKPVALQERGSRERPPLPQMPEYQEVEKSRGQGVDFNSGFRHPEKMPAKYDVDGILLARPFKIVRHGPIRLFCRDLKKMEAFYTGVDRKSTRLNSSHLVISYAVFCLKKNTEPVLLGADENLTPGNRCRAYDHSHVSR